MIRGTAFARAAKILVEEKDFKVLARKIFDIARELTGAASGYVALLSKDATSNEVLFLEAGGQPCSVDRNLPMPIRGLREKAYERLQPVFDNDFLQSEWVKLMPKGHVALNNVLFAPLVVDGTAFGILGLANKTGGGFTQEDAETADTLAELVAIGLKNYRNEAALHESEELFRGTIEQSADGILLTDSAMRITEWNLAMEQMFGYSRGEMIGKHLAEFQLMTMPPELRTPEMLARLKGGLENMQNGRAREWMNRPQEFPVTDKHGAQKFVHISAFPIFTEKGARFGSIIRDITERKQRENQLRIQRDLGIALSRATDLAEGLRLCFDAALKVSGMDCGGVYLFDEKNGDLTLKYHKGLSDEFIARTSRFRSDSPNAGMVRAGNALFTNCSEQRVPQDDFRVREGLRALATIPLRHEGGVIGCLNLASHVFDEIPEGAKLDLEIISQQIASETARFLAKDKLAASEEKFSIAFQRAPLLMSISEISNGAYVDVNRKFLEVSGFSREEVLGKTPVETGWLAADDRGRLVETLRENGRVDGMELLLTSKRGEKIHCLYFGEIIVLDGGRKLLSIAQDITERKKAEDEIRKSEERFRTYFALAPDFCYMISPQGFIIDVNDSALKALGYSREELVGKSLVSALYSPESRKKAAGLFERWKREGFLRDEEMTVLKKDGRELAVLLSASAVHDAAGNILHSISIQRDVTERKKAEESLRASERRNRDLLAAIPDLMFRIRKDGAIVDFKYDRPEQLLLPPEKVRGANILDLPLSGNDRKAAEQSIAAALATGEMQTFQYSLSIAGKNRVYEARAVREDAETVIVIIRDVTELKAAEENQIKTEKLEAIGALAGGIAHDFNNLLGGVFGYLDMAKEQAEAGNGARVAPLLAKALAVFERAKGLTAQFLTFARGGAPAKKTGDLRKTLAETVAFALSGSPVRCTTNIAPDLWTCDYDEHQIGQVIDNIVINAKQAMEKGGTLEVSAANVALEKGSPLPLPNGRYVKVSFKDSGPGIPGDLHRKIFDPFFTTKKKGSGLGLATAFSIVKRHGGHIDLESEPGKGSTFSFWLPAPVKGAAANGEAVSAQGVPSGPEPAARIQKLQARILVMDDEQYMRDLASSALRSLGCTVIVAKNGEEALEKSGAAASANKRFDAAILDLTIPGGMGGKEAAQKLLQADPSACLIVSSGYSDDPIMADPATYGFAAAISKPYKKEALAEILAEVLGKKSGRKK